MRGYNKVVVFEIFKISKDRNATEFFYTVNNVKITQKNGQFLICYILFFFSRILFHTTQPAHLITAFSVLCVAYLMFPSKSYSQISPIWTLLYLGSFSAHFGAQIWMTFVSGLALYFNLPRHTFGNVQQILFPKYFLINATLSLITLAIFLRTNNGSLRTPEIAVQVIDLSCFLF